MSERVKAAIIRPIPTVDTDELDTITDPLDIADRIEVAQVESLYMSDKLDRHRDSFLPDGQWRQREDEITIHEARDVLSTIGSWQCEDCGAWLGLAVMSCPRCRHIGNPLSIIGTIVVRVMESNGLKREDALMDEMIQALNALGIPCGVHWTTSQDGGET